MNYTDYASIAERIFDRCEEYGIDKRLMISVILRITIENDASIAYLKGMKDVPNARQMRVHLIKCGIISVTHNKDYFLLNNELDVYKIKDEISSLLNNRLDQLKNYVKETSALPISIDQPHYLLN